MKNEVNGVDINVTMSVLEVIKMSNRLKMYLIFDEHLHLHNYLLYGGIHFIH